MTSRMGLAAVTALGFPELGTSDWGAYEELAVALATDPARLTKLKRGLSAARATAPLFDTRRCHSSVRPSLRTWPWLRSRLAPPRAALPPACGSPASRWRSAATCPFRLPSPTARVRSACTGGCRTGSGFCTRLSRSLICRRGSTPAPARCTALWKPRLPRPVRMVAGELARSGAGQT